MRDMQWSQQVRSVAEAEPHDIVIVGGGVSGHRCGFDLRRNGYRGAVTLISKEMFPPYDRTLLSKDMLHDAESAEMVLLSDFDSYHKAGINLRLGLTADWLDPDQRCIGLNDGSTLSFDRLVLSVGGSPILPPSLDAPGVLVVREAAGLGELRQAMVPGTHMVVIGGGFIGGEVAAAARELNVEVTLVEAASQPLATVLGEEVGARVAALHRAHGVKVLTGAAVSAVIKDGKEFEVSFPDGTRLAADSVVVGVGMRPNTDWLLESGIDIDRGVITDANCRTSADPVFAAGDCARWWHPQYSELCRAEHWDTANRHGAAVAKAVMGDEQSFAPLPFFWSDQHGVKFQFAGRTQSWDEVRVGGDSPSEFEARYYTAGDLTGVLVAGQPRVFASLRRELDAGATRLG